MKKKLELYKYAILITSLVILIMTPLWEATMTIPFSLIIVLSFTLVIFASINVAEKKTLRLWIFLVGIGALISIWTEFASGYVPVFTYSRITFTLALFFLLFYALVKNVIGAEKICVEMIVGVMSGFLLLGIIGGIAYESLELCHPHSLEFSADSGNYGYFYFSFISLTSLGFGDVIPQTSLAQSFTVLLGILGQFYLAFGVTVFIGKFLNNQS